MNTYIYDGSFEGLLTAIFYAYEDKSPIEIISRDSFIHNLLSIPINIDTELDKYTRVYNSIKNKLSSSTLKKVYYVYLYDLNNSETLIYKYLKLCFKYGDNINLAKNNNTILTIDKYYRRVSLEAHRFTGFVRFKEINKELFYSSIEPDSNILPVIIKHFQKRFSDQNFIIHDTKRKIAIIYNKKESLICDFSESATNFISNYCSEDKFEELWQNFYDSVNIKERENPKLRNRYMPKRYHKNLTEIQ